MGKSEFVQVRVDPDTKATLERAAAAEHVTLSTFVTKAALHAAAKARAEKSTRQFRGVPTFFRACCMEASAGGATSYEDAGWHLAIHLTGLLESDDAKDEQAKLTELETLLNRDDRDGLLAWLARDFPKCLDLVPRRRRDRFLDGVLRAHEDGRILG